MNWTTRYTTLFAGTTLALAACACSDSDSDSNDGTANVNDPTEEMPSGSPATDATDPPASVDGETAGVGNIVEVARAAGSFDTLLAAADAAGLVQTLSGEGPLTVFAPTDAAFDALPEGVLDALLADPEELAAVLSYHVVSGAIPSTAIEDGARVDTVLGPWLTAAVSDDGVSIGEASVSTADVAASNGVIHVIDQVLIPPATIAEIAAANPDLSTLVTAVDAAGLLQTLSGPGTFTVFAPTNAAFDALPEGTLDALLEDTEALSGVLLFHVIGTREPASSVVEADAFEMLSGQVASVKVDGSNVLVAGARVVGTDIVARNGVIHVIGDVMLPPAGQ